MGSSDDFSISFVKRFRFSLLKLDPFSGNFRIETSIFIVVF